MTLLLQLYWKFFTTGLFAIGGGMATIPFLYNISDTTSWFTYNDLADMIAVSESTPGPIGINMATYVGFITGTNQGGSVYGIIGAIVATLGLITPSIIVILLIAAFLKNFKDNKYVKNAFYGLRPASTGLITAAGLGVFVTTLIPGDWTAGFSASSINWKGCILAVVLWLFTNKIKKTKGLHPIIFIAASAVVGIVFSMG